MHAQNRSVAGKGTAEAKALRQVHACCMCHLYIELNIFNNFTIPKCVLSVNVLMAYILTLFFSSLLQTFPK